MSPYCLCMHTSEICNITVNMNARVSGQEVNIIDMIILK